jgi:hypothetical protein
MYCLCNSMLRSPCKQGKFTEMQRCDIEHALPTLQRVGILLHIWGNMRRPHCNEFVFGLCDDLTGYNATT